MQQRTQHIEESDFVRVCDAMETIFNPFERSISFFSARLPTDGELTLNYDQSWKNSVRIEKISSALEIISDVNLKSAFSSVFKIFATAKEILGLE
jgi:hypothetical protein